MSKLHQILVHVVCGLGSVLVWRRCIHYVLPVLWMPDDVMFTPDPPADKGIKTKFKSDSLYTAGIKLECL